MLGKAGPQEVGMLPESPLLARDKLWIDLNDDQALGSFPVSMLFRRKSSSRLTRALQLEGSGPMNELTFM